MPKRPPKGKYTKESLIEWPDDLAADLAAFSAIHYSAPYAEIVRKAVQKHIDAEIQASPLLRERFLTERSRLQTINRELIRLVNDKTQST